MTVSLRDSNEGKAVLMALNEMNGDKTIKEMSDAISEKSKENNVKKEQKISTTYALVNMLKGMVGAGVFALPLSFKQAGLWAGFFVTFLLGAISSVCMIKLVQCSQYLCQRNKKTALDYGQMAEEACLSSYNWLNKFSTFAKLLVNGCLVLLQLGICAVFYIFVVDHAKEIVDHIWVDNGLTLTDYFLIALPAFLLLVSVRTIVAISYVSLMGNVGMTFCLGVILAKMAMATHIPTHTLPAIKDMNGVTLAAGSILYALEGQAMVLPLENKMKHPKDMKGLTGVLATGVNLVTLIYAATGFFGYITYGETTEASVTLNLTDAPLDFSVKCVLLVVMYFGFLIQQFPIVEMCWPFIKEKLRDRKVKRVWLICLELLFRYSIVFIALGLSMAIPNLEEIIPLVGVSAGMMLALVLPAALDIITFLPVWIEGPRWKLWLNMVLDIFYIVLGIFFIVTGVHANVNNIINHGDD